MDARMLPPIALDGSPPPTDARAAAGLIAAPITPVTHAGNTGASNPGGADILVIHSDGQEEEEEATNDPHSSSGSGSGNGASRVTRSAPSPVLTAQHHPQTFNRLSAGGVSPSIGFVSRSPHDRQQPTQNPQQRPQRMHPQARGFVSPMALMTGAAPPASVPTAAALPTGTSKGLPRGRPPLPQRGSVGGAVASLATPHNAVKHAPAPQHSEWARNGKVSPSNNARAAMLYGISYTSSGSDDELATANTLAAQAQQQQQQTQQHRRGRSGSGTLSARRGSTGVPQHQQQLRPHTSAGMPQQQQQQRPRTSDGTRRRRAGGGGGGGSASSGSLTGRRRGSNRTPATTPKSSRSASGRRSSGLTTQPYILDPEAGFPATYDSGSYHGADETERLREELQALKQAFVSKLRGSNRFVSGGQFRVSNRKGGVSPGGAGAGVRAQLLKAKAQNRELREAVQDLQTRYLDADNQLKFAMSQRAGLDFQMRQMAQERDGLRESCNERDLALSKLREELAARDEASQSTSDEEVNKLREALASAQADVNRMRESNAALQEQLHTLQADAQAAPSPCKCQHTIIPAMQRDLDGALDSAAAARSELTEQGHRLEEVRVALEDATQAQADAEAATSDARKALAEAEERATKLEWELGSASAKLAEAGVEAANAEMRYQQALARSTSECQCAELQGQVSDLEAALADAEKALALARGAEREASALVAASEARHKAEKAEQRNDLAKTQRKLSDAQAALQAKEQEVTLAKADVTRAEAAAASSNSEAEELRRQLQQKDDDIRASQSAARGANDRVGLLELQLARADADVIAAKAYAERAVQDAKADALERTLQSMVRLCVVAPTVNVQVGGNQDVLACKPHLPHMQLQTVIQEQVLPKFVSAFLQSEDATAPDGSPLNEWLRSLAADMQRSIEKHLQSQFASSGDAGSAAGSPPAGGAESGGGGGGAAGELSGMGSSTRSLPPRPSTGRASRTSTGSTRRLGSASRQRRASTHSTDSDEASVGSGGGRSIGGRSTASTGRPQSAFSSRGAERPASSATTRRSPIGGAGAGGGAGGGGGGSGDKKTTFKRSKSHKQLKAGLSYGRSTR